MNAILEQQNISTRSEGAMVILTFGGFDITIDYNTAFQIAQGTRVAAKQAKRFAGDFNKVMSVHGHLTAKES